MDHLRDSPHIVSFLMHNIQYILRKMPRELQVKLVKLCISILCLDDVRSIVNYSEKIHSKGKEVKTEIITRPTTVNSCSYYNFQSTIKEAFIDRWPTPGKPWFDGVDLKNFLAIDVEGVKPYGNKYSLPAVDYN